MVNPNYLLKSFLIISFILSLNEAFGNNEILSKRNYENAKVEKAVVIYGVNWGRKWGCGGVENAQLQSIFFSRADTAVKTDDIKLTSPSRSLSKDLSRPYAILVNPGKYSLKGFDIKIARSKDHVEHKKWTDNGNVNGGTFDVKAGEMVYIGDFGLDCTEEPILWRYYIEINDFGRFASQFKKKYKFTSDKEIVYRLFQTQIFGK